MKASGYRFVCLWLLMTSVKQLKWHKAPKVSRVVSLVNISGAVN